MVISMVDVGEQTGALPEMLMKIADNYDEEVDNAVAAMTSLLEPIMIVFLAVIVGSIVIAMFLPLIASDGIGDFKLVEAAQKSALAAAAGTDQHDRLAALLRVVHPVQHAVAL
jgi:hypothetical protein